MKEKILLHICCGPCALFPLRRLEEKFEVTGLWFNPNIHPYAEYRKRLMTAGYTFLKLERKLLVRDEYNVEQWFESILPAQKEKKRCEQCYYIRLCETAEIARTNGIKFFTTTLLVSPYQSKKSIKEAGLAVEKETGVEFYYEDFSPGYREGATLSHEWGLYHQNYCGCLFSEEERLKGKT